MIVVAAVANGNEADCDRPVVPTALLAGWKILSEPTVLAAHQTPGYYIPDSVPARSDRRGVAESDVGQTGGERRKHAGRIGKMGTPIGRYPESDRVVHAATHESVHAAVRKLSCVEFRVGADTSEIFAASRGRQLHAECATTEHSFDIASRQPTTGDGTRVASRHEGTLHNAMNRADGADRRNPNPDGARVVTSAMAAVLAGCVR